jgi:NodT family efflux transporter outer membrane factor (OMF) lipoprotein
MLPLRTRVTFSGSAVLAIAMGCAVKSPPAPHDQLTSILPPTTVVPPEWKATGGASGAVATEWLSTFGDPQLEALVNEGLQNNLDLYAAAARIDVAFALVAQARALLYPQLSINSGLGLVGHDSVSDKSGLTGEISWELDLWGRVRAQAASATANRQANEADLVYARQSLAAIVATTWYQTIASERSRVAAEEAAGLYSDLLGLVRTRNQIGQVGQEDVALAGADLDRARQRERSYATSVQHTVRGLEVVLGRYPAAEVALAPDLPAVPAPVPAGLPSELLERRPDLVAAERRVAAAFHLIQAAEAARLPRLALTASGGRSTSELLALAGVPPGFWQAGIGMVAPLFTGGALQAQVARANADQRAALAMYGQTALRAFSEVEGALASEQLLADQERYLESVLAQDTDALRLGRLRYDIGATDLLHVLQLQGRQLNSRFELIGLRNSRLANRVALHLALGGGFAQAPTP